MLTEHTIKSTKPCPGKRVRLFDIDGLYLEIPPSGGKWWRIKYRFQGKENRLSFGTYPKVSLKAARAKRNALKALIDQGMDPSSVRKAEKDARLASYFICH
ncbi:MAG: Arm DNA-binding domain-containing protein [Gammaproteobacteria bacterium]